MPRTRDRRRIRLYCNRFSKVVRIRAAPDDQQRGAGQRYQSMLEWWSREKLPPSLGTNGPKVATVAKMKEPMGVVPGANRKEDFPQQSDVSAEQLGSQTSDNVEATGERTTTATPAGRIGNDVPIMDTHEVWTSNEMKLVLLQKWMDPRTGVPITHLADFSRAKPKCGAV